jgi:hypothetical protein
MNTQQDVQSNCHVLRLPGLERGEPELRREKELQSRDLGLMQVGKLLVIRGCARNQMQDEHSQEKQNERHGERVAMQPRTALRQGG